MHDDIPKSGIKVVVAPLFAKHLKNFPKADREKIRIFAEHIENTGFVGLIGRNKNSDNVPTDDPNWSKKVAYAQKHRLWHYHIGVPTYNDDKPDGDKTSEYVLHYILNDHQIILVDMSAHPPFELPSEQALII